jgi:hypothetical protein
MPEVAPPDGDAPQSGPAGPGSRYRGCRPSFTVGRWPILVAARLASARSKHCSPIRQPRPRSQRPDRLRSQAAAGRAGPAPPVGGPHARPPVVAERPAPQDRLSRPVREAARQQATDRRVARRARSPPRSAAPAYGSAGDRPDSTCSCRCSRGVSCACIARRPRQARRSWSSSHRGSVTRTSPPGLVDRTTTSRYCAR